MSIPTDDTLAAYMGAHHLGPALATPQSVICVAMNESPDVDGVWDDIGMNGRLLLPGSSKFTRATQRLQRRRIPVTRNSDGFFYALNRSECDFLERDLIKRAASIQRALEAIRLGRLGAHDDGLFDEE